jgi:hypothetical protein
MLVEILAWQIEHLKIYTLFSMSYYMFLKNTDYWVLQENLFLPLPQIFEELNLRTTCHDCKEDGEAQTLPSTDLLRQLDMQCA